jgi:hypothetical protein
LAAGKVLTPAKRRENRLRLTHGWCMAISWGFLLPAGITIAAFKSVKPFKGSTAWFQLHRAMMILGFLLSLAGVGLGAQLPVNRLLKKQHRTIGITVTVLAGLQCVLPFLWRPKPDQYLRRHWNMLHYIFGRAALALAFANLFIGLYLTHRAQKWSWAVGITTGTLVALIFAKNIIEYLFVPVSPAEEQQLLTEALNTNKARHLEVINTPPGKLADLE